jgi:hypothetical protein
MKITEYESEPIPGLPEQLPPGEKILWQGSPKWKSFAKHVFHVNKIAMYFGVLLFIQILSKVYSNYSLGDAIQGTLWFVLVAWFTIVLLLVFAYLFSKASIYTLTNQRIVLRFGVAIQMIVNLPWNKVNQADLKAYKDSSGDISLTLSDTEKVSYLIMWPHVKPWRITKAQPMLRNVPDAKEVAGKIAHVLEEHSHHQQVLMDNSDDSSDVTGTQGLMGT